MKTLKLFLLLIITTSAVFNKSEEVNSLIGPLQYEEDNEITDTIKILSNFLSFNKQSENFLVFPKENSDHKDSFVCKSCLWFFNHIHDILMKKYGGKVIFKLVSLLCSLGLQHDVCNEYINLYAPVIYDSLIDHYLTGEYVCTLSKLCKTKHFIELNADDYARELLKDKPLGLNNPPIDPSAKTWKVLQVADIHVDSLYSIGSRGKCADPLCCRASSNSDILTEEEKAGQWGFVGKCDIPYATLQHFTDFALNEIKPDFIIWTGDNPPHDPWTGSQELAFNATKTFTDLLNNKYNYTLPVYPVVGNHEMYPNDEYNPFGDRDKFLYERLGDLFKKWLGDEAYETFSKYGYYTKLHPNSNLRIVSTNCLLCDTLNFNLIKNPADPKDEIKWLENVLKKAEENKEVVYLIRHIPIGDGFFLNECSKRHQALLDRFSYIIRGQFYGHTHNDEIKIAHEYFDYNKISSVLFIAPSLTTVYEVDSNTKIPKDYLQYRLIITKANSDSDLSPVWEISYRASNHFNVKYLNDTEGLYKYALDIDTDPKVFNIALKAFYADGPYYFNYLNNSGNILFNYSILEMPRYLSCRFRETTFAAFFKCINYKTLFLQEYIYKGLNKLSGQWYEKLVN